MHFLANFDSLGVGNAAQHHAPRQQELILSLGLTNRAGAHILLQDLHLRFMALEASH